MIIDMEMNNTLTGLQTEDTPFMSINKFTEEIESIVFSQKISYMEAVLFFCETNDIDVEDIAPFVSLLMKQKIENDAIEAGLLPRRGMLPL